MTWMTVYSKIDEKMIDWITIQRLMIDKFEDLATDDLRSTTE